MWQVSYKAILRTSVLFLMGIRLMIWNIFQHILTRKVMAYKMEEISYTPREFQELADM